MECKKCAKDLSDQEYKQVARWAFCLDCFQELMDQAEKKQQGEVDQRPEEQASEATTGQQYCLLCEQQIPTGNSREMLGLVFCEPCYENLVKRPAVKPRPTAPDEEQSEPAVAQVQVDVSAQIRCYGCNRQIPVLGSKEFDHESYCPDCYQALPEIKAQQPRAFPRADAESLSVDTDFQPGKHCQACLREVLPAHLDTVEGFEICRQCLVTDSATAMVIARARHRKALAEMQKKLGE